MSFFDTCQPYMTEFLNQRYSDAVKCGIEFLSECKQFAPSEYERTSKGTPFYLMAIAAFLSHDFQTATFLFDAAVSEDLKHQPDNANTPALLTMQLNEENKEQAAFQIVRQVATQIKDTLSSYNSRAGHKPLSISDIRKHFLQRFIRNRDPWSRTLTTTFISFFFEWSYRAKLIGLSEAGSREVFFTHLFRGCLLFESLLKENPRKPSSKPTLARVLKELNKDLRISSILNISSYGFDPIVRSLTSSQSIEEAIKCTGKTRNTLGHNLVWMAASLDAANYNLLAENIGVSCLHAISCLYK